MIADLVDMSPLLQALGDHAHDVVEAAEASFERIGLGAIDALLEGLGHERPGVRECCFRLIKGLGQSARDELLSALHSPNSRLASSVASLLATLGALEELADALIWSAPEHHPGIVEGLLQAGAAAANPLLSVLLKAPPERQQVLINAVSALKMSVQIDRRIEALRRATRDPEARELLRRVLDASPSGFAVGDVPALPDEATSDSEPALPARQSRLRRRLLDRRRS